jgi:hypothetical protein
MADCVHVPRQENGGYSCSKCGFILCPTCFETLAECMCDDEDD